MTKREKGNIRDLLKKYIFAGCWWCISLITALRGQSQTVDSCVFKASIVYKISSMIAREAEKPSLKKQTKQQTEQSNSNNRNTCNFDIIFEHKVLCILLAGLGSINL